MAGTSSEDAVELDLREIATQVPQRAARLGWMDTLRVTAVLLVVLEHAIDFNTAPLPDVVVQANNLLTPFRIPALVFLSGMLLQRSLAKPQRTYLAGKFNHIAWPYLVWSCIAFLIQLAGEPPKHLLVSLFLNPDSPMWYLAYLFTFYLVALALPSAARGWLVPAAIAAAFFLPDDSNAERCLYALAFFMAGDVFMRHYDRVAAKVRSRPFLVLAAVLAVGTAIASALGITVRYDAMFAVPTLAAILAMIPLFEWLSRTAVGRRLSHYGASTLIFYVVSFPAQLVTMKALTHLGFGAVLVSLGTLVAGLGAGAVALALQNRIFVLRYLFDLRPKRRAAAS